MKTVSLHRNQVHSGHLILVNRQYPYKEIAAGQVLVPVGNEKSVLLERQYAALYTKLMNDLRAWKQITPISGWRSHQEQERIYSESLLENGADFTAQYVALPGHSEHQTGLAVDLALNMPKIDFLRPHFPHTGICGAFRSKAGQFGFIERYPKGKEAITGIAYEPWHFRYVGVPHAMIMNRTGDTLEEYHARLKLYPFGQKPLTFDFGGTVIELSYLAADEENVAFEMEENAVFTVSGNNMDGFVIAVWRDRI